MRVLKTIHEAWLGVKLIANPAYQVRVWIWVWIALGEIGELEEDPILTTNHNPTAMPPSSISFFLPQRLDIPHCKNVVFNLFQVGRFMDNQFTMMYLPAKPKNPTNWIECFNRGASIKPAGVDTEGYTYYTWQSAVALPRFKLTPYHWTHCYCVRCILLAVSW